MRVLNSLFSTNRKHMTPSRASMKEFINFHGMLISPSSASRCVSSIDGVVLFMPTNYRDRGIAAFDVTYLNTLTYYLLVIFSLTGLSTALRLTDFLEAAENLRDGLESPEVTADILAYVAARSGAHAADLRVVRRFALRLGRDLTAI